VLHRPKPQHARKHGRHKRASTISLLFEKWPESNFSFAPHLKRVGRGGTSHPPGLEAPFPFFKQAAEKVCTGQESNTSGAKALMLWLFTARLKSCPDTKHEFFRSL
jgi:hypothetical protein